MYSGNRRFQCLSNYFSNYKSLLFCCPKSKKRPLIIWGETGIFSGRGHENKCEGSNGPIPTMTSWQNAMTSAFYYLPHFNLLYYCLTFSFLLSSYIFWGKEYKSICKIFHSCKVSYPKIQALLIWYEKYAFTDRGC